MDGNGALFGTLSGNTRDVVHKFSVDLPKKHGRGGQSALRFAVSDFPYMGPGPESSDMLREQKGPFPLAACFTISFGLKE